MGVLNVTPDSFSDGGTLFSDGTLAIPRVLDRAAGMVADGAAILDIGGESTRPGATPVGIQEELDRVVPCVEALSGEFDVVLSIDTSSPEVMRAAAASGAGMINDVRALQREGALAVAAELRLPVCLMHMRGTPASMQSQPRYDDVLTEVKDFLLARAQACEAAGLGVDLITLDPGIGFGKSVEHNLALLRGLPSLVETGYPVLVGLSRKSLIGKLLGREVDERLPASLALAVLAAERGARIIRSHDVRATVDALAMVSALVGEEES
ncbi:MAG: dihydropteroate synthase [Halieaceae bacterium]